MDLLKSHQGSHLSSKEVTGVSIIYLGSQQAPPVEDRQPEDRRVYKFVIISSGERLSFLYGPLSEFAYHAGLVRKYCEVNNIPSGWLKRPDVYEIYGTHHKIRGGGWMEQVALKRRARLYGYSTAYGRFNRKDIPILFRAGSIFSDYEIQIEG